jgi:hypothetical protein
MGGFRIRRPSPALVVSFIALLAALGGTSYAAFSLPKSSVGTKQLKKNAVTTAKLKNGAVTGSKIKNGTITRSKINLSKLGAVPNANHANSADSATNATNATHAASADALGYEKTFDITTGDNSPNGQDIATIGPFTLTALCTINSGGTDTAELEIRTTEDHSAYDASPENNDFGPADGKLEFRTSSATTGTTNIEFSSVDSGALAPDGTSFFGVFPVHVNPPGNVGRCRFQGRYTTL